MVYWFSKKFYKKTDFPTNMTKVYFKTYGCTLNYSDTEVMQGILTDVGFDIVTKPEDSEVIVINSCAVKKPTENRFFRYLKEMDELKRPIVITGCIAQTMPDKLKGYSIVGPDNINSIVQIIEETMHDNPMTLLARDRNTRLNLPKIRKNEVVEIIPICHGCLGECAYCIVKSARGDFYSHSKKDILKQARKAVSEGVKELWLTAQDTGCYGHDQDTFLPSLLRDMVQLEGDFFIRIGMMNPNHVLEMLEDLIDIYKHDKLYKFIHIPVQSGSNKTLKKMKRRYTIEDFKRIVVEFRREIPDITISTDIICGYPDESEAEFNESVALVKELKPDVLNISRFWSRPGTTAAKLKQLSGEDTKKRSRLMTTVFEWEAWEKNKGWRNWEGDILIDEKGKNDSWIGRNFAYRPVVIEGDFKLGQKVRVQVFEATSYDLRARPVQQTGKD